MTKPFLAASAAQRQRLHAPHAELIARIYEDEPDLILCADARDGWHVETRPSEGLQLAKALLRAVLGTACLAPATHGVEVLTCQDQRRVWQAIKLLRGVLATNITPGDRVTIFTSGLSEEQLARLARLSG